MTAQVHDSLAWRHQDFLLVGVEGTGLFDAADHGLVTRPTTTANWRGWVARYEVRDNRLILVALDDVGLVFDESDGPPILNGIAPEGEGNRPYTYAGLDWHIPFTGRLLIARGFIQSLYRHMGFHPAWKFEQSWELDLERGELTDARDVSEEMRRLRDKIAAEASLDPDSESRPGWIARTFTLDFLRSRGR